MNLLQWFPSQACGEHAAGAHPAHLAAAEPGCEAGHTCSQRLQEAARKDGLLLKGRSLPGLFEVKS